MPKNRIIRHTFVFGPSPDLDVKDDKAGYLARYAIDQKEQKPIFISTADPGALTFDIDAPLGSVVTVLLSAKDSEGNTSKAVPFEFRVTGKRILRHPGQSPGSLSMWAIEDIDPHTEPEPASEAAPRKICDAQCQCHAPAAPAAAA